MNNTTLSKSIAIQLWTILLLITLPFAALAKDPATEMAVSFTPQSAHIGEHITLNVDVTIPSGFHFYSMTTVEDGPRKMSVALEDTSIAPIGEWFGPKPKIEYDKAFKKNVEYYEGKITYRRNYKVTGPVSGATEIKITVMGQICDDSSCIIQKKKLVAPLKIEDGEPRSKYAAPAKLKGEAFPPNRTVAAAESSDDELELENPADMGLIAFIIMAFIAGLGALVTPCVFPMIPITISFFSKFSKVSVRRSISMASIYAGSIILVFSIVGVVMSLIFGADSMQSFSTHPIFNIFLSLLLIVFAFNLFGLFEIQMPSWLIAKSAEKEQALTSSDDGAFGKQAAGVFFMAVTFTLVSFTCTVGFIGWVLALASQGDAFYPLIGMLAFAFAFALPFFFLAVFPNMAEKLQGKGGDWMVAVKVIFGVIEFAAAFKFLSNLDLHFTWGVMTRQFVLSIWTGLFLIAALYLLRVFALPHNDTSAKSIGPIRMAFALVFFALTAVCFTGIGHSRPMGGWIDAWLPPVPYPGEEEIGTSGESSTDGGHLSFMKDDMKGAFANAQKENKALFIDFTGFQCTNCRQMESGYFPRSSIRSRLEKMVRMSAYTDGPKEVHDQQREYQIKRFKTAALPFYVILDPHNDKILSSFASMADNEEEYIEFLDKGLSAWEQVKPKDAPEAKEPEAEASHGEADAGAEAAAPVVLDLEGPVVDFKFPDLKTGKPVALSSLKGSWVLVNFWASWCAPCKKELTNDFPPALATAPNVKLLTVAFDGNDTKNAAVKFADEIDLWKHINLQGGEDAEEAGLAEAFEISSALPFSYLIDPTGKMVWKRKGSIHKEELIALFAAIPK